MADRHSESEYSRSDDGREKDPDFVDESSDDGERARKKRRTIAKTSSAKPSERSKSLTMTDIPVVEQAEQTESQTALPKLATAPEVIQLDTPKPEEKQETEAVILIQPDSAPVSKLASTLIKLSPVIIRDEMNGIWSAIQSAANMLLVIKPSREAKARILSSPEADMEEIYELLFGEEWPERFMVVNMEDSWTRADALADCLAGAIHKKVFQPASSVLWPGPRDVVARNLKETPAIDRVLQDLGLPNSFGSIIWRAAAEQPDNADFQKTEVKPAAKKIAGCIGIILTPQLQAWRIANRAKLQEGFWKHRVGEVAKIVEKALILAAKIRAAPEHYRLRWPRSGAPFTPRLLEDLVKGKGERVVLWGVTPLVQAKPTAESKWQVVMQAKVFTGPA